MDNQNYIVRGNRAFDSAFQALDFYEKQVDELKQQLAEAQRVTFDPAILENINALEQQRDAAANSALDHASKYSNIVQAITDPENQPSQYGTVTLAMHNELKQQRDELMAALEKAEEYLRECANSPILAAALRAAIAKVKP